MKEDNLTIWQKLSRNFGPHGLLNKEYPTQDFDKKELLRTINKAEYEREKLQAQQSKYLGSQWAKVETHMYSQAVYYEPTRLSSVYDYESMEYTPEISAALDIYSEESTSPDENGHILSIFSESKRVQAILTDLFINVLDINTNLSMWTRNTCKYGDNFVYLKLDAEKGVVGCQQLPNIEIQRIEPGSSEKSPLYVEKSEAAKTLHFSWQNKNIEFQSWEIAHFRLLGDDRKLPYGCSMLEKARRTWKQLVLAEDAMLIYRTSRAPERRVFKVFVGNMDDNDVEAYVQRVANKFKREQIVDSKTGNVDMRYNQMAVDQDYFIPVRDPSSPSPIETLAGACISLNTKIPLIDGRTLELNEIINEWDNGNRNLWVYSCDPKTGELAPGIITWAGVTRKNTEVLKITLDNGKEIISTFDHKFVHRTNGFMEAKDLVVGDSLMPFYTQEKEMGNSEYTYKQIWDNQKQSWVFSHKMVEKYMEKTKTYSEIKNTIPIKDINVHNQDNNLEYFENVNSEFYNHKIIKIEILDYKMDTGTITVDGNELFHDYHTFAIDSGIFIKNSNLGEIADIEYIQKKLVTALRIPKAFLGFEESVGDGKSLALQDIRFARTINRIQRSMISELNKIAIIHLYLLGFEDEITNFTLSLTNPSTQTDLLKIDIWKEKIMLYKDAVSDPGSGIQPVSATWAKKHIFGFSDEEIRVDLQQQRIERAVGEELKATPLTIKKTGLFDNLDKLYGSASGATTNTAQQATQSTDTGGFGNDLGGGLGGDLGLGGAETPIGEPLAGEEGVPAPELAGENRLNNLNLLVENDIIKGKKFINFDQGANSLNELGDEIDKIL